jgi:uncharacterized protein YhbP (UPF0306 family)
VSETDWRPTGTELPSPADDAGVLEVLATTTLTLGTAGPVGRPFGTPVFFAADPDLGLVFFSDPDTLHVQHVIGRPEASATIYPEIEDFMEIRGLQVAGTVERILPGDDWERAWGAYAAKFPFVAGLRPIVDAAWLMVLRPTWIRLIDNRRGFGFKAEWARGEAWEEEPWPAALDEEPDQA